MELHDIIAIYYCQPLDIVLFSKNITTILYTFLPTKSEKKEISISQDSFLVIGSETEKEGFEPSRRVNDLHP